MKIFLAIFILAPAAAGQTPEPLTIGQAVEAALQGYPSVRVTVAQVAAAAAGIHLARTAYLPKVDTLAQWNRATRNNVFGLLLPQPVIAPISGPVLGTNNLASAWGSAVGVLVSWEVFDFGYRRAAVEAAQATEKKAQASVARTRLEVATLTADIFLTALAAEQTVVAARAGVERAKVLEEVVGALVRAQLRPGADLSRTQAERALAETQLIQGEQATEVARATLAQLVGARGRPQPGPLLDLPPAAVEPAPAAAHPLAMEQNAAIDEVKAREKVLDRSWFPKFDLQATSYARGQEGPNTQNWALGLTVTLPVMDYKSIEARREVERSRERAEAARYEQVVRELNGQMERAKAALDGARRVAQNTPVQRQAAREAEQQATARYRAGLGTVAELAETQRLLTGAEIDDALARLSVWRATLAVAAAGGDLGPFLGMAGN